MSIQTYGVQQQLLALVSRYLLSFTDDYPRKSLVYFLKTKYQVFEKFKDWKILIERQTNRKLKYLRIDNDLEFCNEEFNKHCSENDITRHRIVRYTPQQNGVAERLNRTIMERCLLSDVILNDKFWVEAAAYTVYTLSRCPYTSLDFLIIEEKWTNHPPNLDNLNVFIVLGLYIRI